MQYLHYFSTLGQIVNYFLHSTIQAAMEEFRRQGLHVASIDSIQGLSALEEILLGDPDVLSIDGLESPSVAGRALRAAVEG